MKRDWLDYVNEDLEAMARRDPVFRQQLDKSAIGSRARFASALADLGDALVDALPRPLRRFLGVGEKA